MFNPRNRDILGLQKEVTIPILKRPPTNSQGRNGDLLIVQRGGKIFLYCKVAGSWLRQEFTKVSSVTAGEEREGILTGYSHDTGWFSVNDSVDSNSLLDRQGYYKIEHNSACDLVRTEVFCRFEGLRDGGNDYYTVNLNSHISNSGPNASRYGYWVNILDPNTIELNISPDGLSILHSDLFSDANSNTSTLISSNDSDNVGIVEMRVFVYPLIKNSTGKKAKSNEHIGNTSKEIALSKNGTRISTGKSVVSNAGASVDGTKNSSFTIDSDGTGVLLKNDSGALKVRNAADSADAEINASRLQFGAIAGTAGIAIGQIRYDSDQSAFVASGAGLLLSSYLSGSSGDTASFILSSYTADSFIQFRDGGSARWAIGHDQSDSNKFKIEQGSVLADASTLTLDSNAALELFGTSSSLKLSYDANNYATMVANDSGDLTITTVGGGTTDSDLVLDIDGDLYIDVDGGTARITDGGGTYTPDHATSIATKAYVDENSEMKHTAVWGGELARVAASGTWLGIPTGYSMAALQMGTGSSPDTSYTVSTTADDLVTCIWASMHDITVTGCKVWVGQGGGTNTAHDVSLMRYDIDADGDLSNGVLVGSGGSIFSDDYSQARAHTMTLSATAANRDIDFSDGQILIAFVEPTSAYNAYMAAKVILEYTEVET